MRRPLRSKRAMISPVRPRSKASGLTRIRVRSIHSPWEAPAREWAVAVAAVGAPGLGGRLVEKAGLGLGPRLFEDDLAARGATLALAGPLGSPLRRRLPPAAPAGARRRRRRPADDLGLAEGAYTPCRVDRLPAAAARLLQLLHAVRAAQERRLDLVPAARAGAVLEHLQPPLGGPDLQL